MLDVEIKREATAVHIGETSSAMGRLNPEGRRIMQAALLNGGNLEIQEYNTGTVGNKSLKNNKLANAIIGGLTLRDRIGNKKISDMAKGLSDYV